MSAAKKAAPAEDKAAAGDAKEASARAAVRIPTFKTKEQLQAEKVKRARARRRKKEKEEAERKAREKAEEELRIATETENKKWKDALTCLAESCPRLQDNPWLIIQEPVFIHRFLDSLTDSFMSFEKHEDETKKFIDILQTVYVVLVDVGKFARYQPSFFLTNPHTIRLFVRLLEQVAHAKADNTLFPNVLNILLPTIAKPALYDLLADARMVTALMGFARDEWLPAPAVLEMVLGIIKTLSSHARLRDLFLADDGYDKLRELGLGLRPGLTPAQQEMVLASVSHFPPYTPKPQPVAAAPAAGAAPGAAGVAGAAAGGSAAGASAAAAGAGSAAGAPAAAAGTAAPTAAAAPTAGADDAKR